MNEALAIITALGSLNLLGILYVIFRAGVVRQQLATTMETVQRIDNRGCMYGMEHGKCAPAPAAVPVPEPGAGD